MLTSDGIRVVDRCRERGIQLRAENGQVRWKATDGEMTVDLLREIKAHQAEIAETLEKKRRDQLRVFVGDAGEGNVS